MKPLTEERAAVRSLQSKMGQKMAPSHMGAAWLGRRNGRTE